MCVWKRWLRLWMNIYILLHSVASLPQEGSRHLQHDELPADYILEALYRGLQYMYENILDVDIDAYFGVVVAHGQIEAIPQTTPKLEEIKNLTRKILEERKNIPKPNNDNLANNMCLSQLIDEVNYKKRQLRKINFNCNISKECHEILLTGEPHGYRLTHRVLYFLMSRALGCTNRGPLAALCCSVMEEAAALQALRYPPSARDLFMEQVLVCGLSGFNQFVQNKWIKLALKWQRKDACWGLTNRTHRQNIFNGKNVINTINEKMVNIKSRRSTQALGPSSCSSHSTGLGVALLALATKNAFSYEKSDKYDFETY